MQLSDTHNDFLTKLTQEKCFSYLKSCESQGVSNLLCSVFTSEYVSRTALEKIEQSNEILREFGKPSYKLHVEDMGCARTEADIKTILKCSPFSCSLTWNNDNQYAGGNFGFSGITKKGKKLIKQFNEKKIILDVAHLNRKSFFEYTKSANTPIFCSHTGLNFIKKSPRNLTEVQVKTIIESNGYIGLFISPMFGSKDGTMNSMVFAQIIFKALCHFGTDNTFGIGTDFFGIGKEPDDLKSYSDFNMVAQHLKSFGVCQATVNKVFYQNFCDFCKTIK